MRLLIYLLTAAILFAAPVSFAESDSLNGLKKAKFVVDLNQGKPELLNLRLSLILETILNIKDEGVTPDVVVAIRGKASAFMTSTDKYIDKEDAEIKKEIYNKLKSLSEKGVKLEQCAIALRLLKIDKEDIYPDITIVANGYVSLIAYQNQGYALLPME